jgi:integrase
MSGSRVPHLQRRHGTYHLRVRVPDDLRLRVGLREIRRSLRVHTFAQARPLALTYAARVMEVFEMARTQPIAREDIRSLVQACFADISRQMDDGFFPKTDRPDLEVEEQQTLFADQTVHVSAQLAARDFGHPVTTEVARVLRQAGLSVEGVPEARMADLCSGVARALLERDRLFRFRLAERLLPYQPLDPLFHMTAAPAPMAAFAIQSPALSLGETLGAAIQTYLKEGKAQWSPKTHKDREKKLSYLVQHIGAERALSTITAQDLVAYRDAIRRLRKQSKRTAGASFITQQTENAEARISQTTAENIFVPCKAFFGWAKGDQGLIAVNPAENVRFPKVKAVKGGKPRRPFKANELERLFSSPVFTGMKSAKRRFEPGSLVVKGAYFWLPVLGYYTGARLGELVQLHVADIHLDGPVPYINISEDGGELRGSGLEKSVKSDAGVRKVPIHPDVMALGFAAFVAKALKDKRNKRLFWEVAFGADGQASTVFSKWFARLMDKAGLSDPSLVFHSFRHTAEDAFRNASAQQYVIDRIIGHSGGKVSDGYGEGISLETASEALIKAKLPVSLLKLIH